MRIADTLKKAASLVMEFDEEPQSVDSLLTARPVPEPAMRPAPVTKTIEQIVRDTPGPNLDEIKAAPSPSTPTEPVITPDGKVNYPSIYKQANLPDSAFTAEQVLELLASLPAELPIEAKRATLKVTLNAMTKSTGVTPETVVADASRKLAALASYAQSYVQQANEYIVAAEAEIKKYEAEIERRKAGIEDAKHKHAQMVESCQKESDRLDDVLEFFSMDVAPSKYAPPTA